MEIRTGDFSECFRSRVKERKKKERVKELKRERGKVEEEERGKRWKEGEK